MGTVKRLRETFLEDHQSLSEANPPKTRGNKTSSNECRDKCSDTDTSKHSQRRELIKRRAAPLETISEESSSSQLHLQHDHKPVPPILTPAKLTKFPSENLASPSVPISQDVRSVSLPVVSSDVHPVTEPVSETAPVADIPPRITPSYTRSRAWIIFGVIALALSLGLLYHQYNNRVTNTIKSSITHLTGYSAEQQVPSSSQYPVIPATGTENKPDELHELADMLNALGDTFSTWFEYMWDLCGKLRAVTTADTKAASTDPKLYQHQNEDIQNTIWLYEAISTEAGHLRTWIQLLTGSEQELPSQKLQENEENQTTNPVTYYLTHSFSQTLNKVTETSRFVVFKLFGGTEIYEEDVAEPETVDDDWKQIVSGIKAVLVPIENALGQAVMSTILSSPQQPELINSKMSPQKPVETTANPTSWLPAFTAFLQHTAETPGTPEINQPNGEQNREVKKIGQRGKQKYKGKLNEVFSWIWSISRA